MAMKIKKTDKPLGIILMGGQINAQFQQQRDAKIAQQQKGKDNDDDDKKKDD